jgi:outer membrane receptor protein involved in Fe transport
MIKKLQSAFAFLILISFSAVAQTGTIKGKIYDKATKEPLPFASVVAELGGANKGGSQSDFDGEYTIKPLPAGEYAIKVSYVGYNDLVITGVLVSIDKITFQDLLLSKKVLETKEVEIVAYKVPLIDKGNPAVQSTVTREEIEAAPTRDVRSVAATAAGVFQKDEGDDLNIRGTRSESTDYYIDGIRIRGSKKLPQAGVEQITVVTGGVPAQYGDNTGGVISITTRGPSQEYSAGAEVVTSELFDSYGYNLASLNFSGPLYKKKTAEGASRTILGFFVTGEVQSERDPDPSAIGMYQLKDNVYNDLKANPIIPQLTNAALVGPQAYGAVEKGEYLRADSFEKSKNKKNVDQLGIRFTAKLDFQPAPNTNITLGGSFDRNDRNSFLFDRAAYNFEENPQILDQDYRVFARLTQKVASTMGSEKENSGLLKNVFFSIQAEYSKNLQTNQDKDHKNNFWNYGYVGKFAANRFLDSDFAVLVPTADSSGSQIGTNTYINYINHFSYTPGDINEEAKAYTNTATAFLNSIYNSGAYTEANLNNIGLYGVNSYQDLSIIRAAGGLRNGDNVSTVWGMWQNIGNPRNTYQDFDNDQFRVTISGNADIKDHELSMGFEFEQRVDRGFSLAPRGLWTLGRQKANENLNQVYVVQSINGLDTTFIQENAYNNPTGTIGFYEKIRSDLGLSVTDFVDFDALNPDQLKLSYFDPEFLIDNGLLGSYYGYDYTGENFTGNPSFKDFFTKKENGVYTREIGAFRPTYMAGYIQDKFAIDNLIFNVGLRVDRFDANQKQLKDKYLLNDAYTVGNYPVAIPNKPSNIGDDFVPYLGSSDVNDIVGYRKNDVWYNAQGQIVSDPDFLAQQSTAGTILPALVDPKAIATEDWEIDKVFKDYEPQYNIMPRVAFSFPISDEALFFAHYDVLTQRPSGRLRTDPLEYLALRTNPDAEINNGGLKPEKTTDYEVGFRQTLSKSSALSISAFYREMSNMIQVRKIVSAYPNTYRSYDNIDFGTVKGISVNYDLRRTSNVRLTVAYTLQFADGTGSGDRSGLELVDTDQPNLRILSPLDFDQRHTLVASFDYRYEKGANYNGPIWFGKQVFSNAGANFIAKANSGAPYTRQSRATQEANAIGWQDNGQRAVEGGVNQGRNPWRFTVDLRLNKEFEISAGKKSINAEVYFLVQNLLDTRNVIAVYRATGNADDDGYLASVEGQNSANSQVDPQAFTDQYNLKVRNPDNFSLPRRARLGLNINF